MVLLEVKDFLHKNKKLAEIYKGPYIITKVSENNTATIKKMHGIKEYNITLKCLNYITQTQNNQIK